MADTLGLLAKLVERNARIINVLAQASSEHARLLELARERCCRNGCKQAATVRHLSLGVRCCDWCAASLIIKAKRDIGTDNSFTMNMLRGVVMEEEAWVDLPGAKEIRHAQDVIDLLDHGFEADLPEDPQEWH